MPENYSYGAKVYGMKGSDSIVIQQTVKMGSKEYKIDRNPDKSPVRRIVSIKDDKNISDAIRRALTGKL